MRIQYFIFNYAHFTEARFLLDQLLASNCDAYLLNCESPKDPVFEQTDRIKKFPNIYYSGQWNEALKLLTGDVAFLINSDVSIKSVHRLHQKVTNFYTKWGDKAGIYAPNLWWTPWTYNPSLLEDIGDNCKKVPATDSTIWAISSTVAEQVGPLNLQINNLGWGIEIVAAYYCSMQNKLVVRDYSIKCGHPKNTAYDRHEADRQWRKWADVLGLGQDFWRYYNSRDNYGFGWNGNDTPAEDYKLLL